MAKKPEAGWVLVKEKGEGPELLPLAGDALLLGTARDCHLVVAARGVSRRHARLEVREESVFLEDLGSKNGTFSNGTRIEGKVRLAAGDRLSCGAATYVLSKIAPEDLRVAVKLERPSQAGCDPESTTEEASQVPANFLQAIVELAKLAEKSRSELATVCQIVARTLQAHGLLLVRGGLGRATEILAAFGSNLPLARVEELASSLARQTRLGKRPVCGFEKQEFTTAFAMGGDGLWLALACTGEEICGRSVFLAGVVEILARKLLTLSEGDGEESVKAHELLYPAGHVLLPSRPMQGVYGRIREVARADFPVLFQGETGVGKEHMVKVLHLSSGRKGQLVAVNCAAIPAELLEAELFGIERGVATGVTAREGKFQQAWGGTLFLDEVGELPYALQAKLLRALDQGEVVPLGARKPLKIDARVVSATNRELASKVQDGRFRADLYYRLAGIVIEIPPLRSHPEDVPLLVTSFLQREAERWKKPLRGLSERALRALVAYSWPGNIRQLEHEVRRLVTACPPGGLVTYELLSPVIKAASVGRESEPVTGSLRQRVAQLEREVISEALQASDGSLQEAARLLGMSRYGLSLKLKRLGLVAGEISQSRPSRRPRR